MPAAGQTPADHKTDSCSTPDRFPPPNKLPQPAFPSQRKHPHRRPTPYRPVRHKIGDTSSQKILFNITRVLIISWTKILQAVSRLPTHALRPNNPTIHRRPTCKSANTIQHPRQPYDGRQQPYIQRCRCPLRRVLSANCQSPQNPGSKPPSLPHELQICHSAGAKSELII